MRYRLAIEFDCKPEYIRVTSIYIDDQLTLFGEERELTLESKIVKEKIAELTKNINEKIKTIRLEKAEHIETGIPEFRL